MTEIQSEILRFKKAGYFCRKLEKEQYESEKTFEVAFECTKSVSKFFSFARRLGLSERRNVSIFMGSDVNGNIVDTWQNDYAPSK